MKRQMIALAILAVGCGRPSPDSPSTDNSAAGSQDPGSAPLTVVQEYVSRDAQGERLRSNAWFMSVVTWPDDPGYDSHTAIRSYTVSPAQVTGDSAVVQVEYRVLAWIVAGDTNSTRVMPHDSLETQRFRLVRTDGKWLIAGPQIDQHVLLDRARQLSLFGAADRARLDSIVGAVQRS
jgi:hypothetical protein